MRFNEMKVNADIDSPTNSSIVVSTSRVVALIIFVSLITACQPSDQRPGLWLSGEQASSHPGDWIFTDELHEIYVQVRTPYFIPHSVTIWCAQVDGQLYIAARNPDTKNWPSWIQKEPAVTLKVAGTLYDVNTEVVNDAAEIDEIKSAYAQKYQLSPKPGETPPPMRYWRIHSA